MQPPSHERIIEDLMETLEIIALNAGYPRYFETPAALTDHHTYFEICQRILPELNIKIIKIHEYRAVSPGQKLQQLLELLWRELEVEDFGDIDGEAIVRGDLGHIYKLLEVFYEYSKIYVESRKRDNDVRSASWKTGKDEEDIDEPHPNSARQFQRDYGDYDIGGDRYARQEEPENEMEPETATEQSEERQEEESQEVVRQPKKHKKKRQPRPVYSASAKRERSSKQARSNLHSSLVRTIMEEKTNTIRAGARNSRYDRLGDVKQAKKQFSQYLQRHAKDGRAEQVRNSMLEAKKPVKKLKDMVPRQQFDKIDNFFQSFECKLRDAKAVYLRKMQQVVRRQERDRFCHENRVKREAKQMQADRLRGELDRQSNEYRVRSDLLKENREENQRRVSTWKLEERERASQSRREMKEQKGRELERIFSLLRQDNERVLMGLQEGGSMQKAILKMYKKL